MKFISWNVNGLRAIVNKNFLEVFQHINADFFCLQEIKMQKGQLELDLPGYFQYYNYAIKKGYSGTAIFTKHKPKQVYYGMNKEKYDQEGRLITLEYSDFYIITCYTPNSQNKLQRLDYRMEWEDAFYHYVTELKEKKAVIICGDLNVAHKKIDLKNWKTNQNSAGFTVQERQKFTFLLESGFIDTFRYFYPEKEKAYSWWSYRFNARKNNAGWRIDYFLVSTDLKHTLLNASILNDITGSDHCPILLETKQESISL